MKQLLYLTPILLLMGAPASGQFHLPGTGGKPDAAAPASAPARLPAATSIPVPKAAPAVAASPAASFDYYAFSLAWTGGRFIVRGLMPLSLEGKSPESCEAKPASKAALSVVASVMPDKDQVRAEWARYGSCTGLTPADHFTDIRLARSLVQIPVQLTSLDTVATESPLSIESQFVAANPGFTGASFRTACANQELTEVRVCFDKKLAPRECTVTAGECSSAIIRIQPGR